MTDVTPPLASSDVRKAWYGDQYLSFSPNPTCYSARVNGAISGGESVAEITFDAGTGVLASIEPGMTVLISHTSNKYDAYLRLRTRKATAILGTLYVNETSAEIDDNDYIFVLWDWDVWPKLPRDTGTTRYNDYDDTFSATNNGMPPIISDLEMVYVGETSSGILQIRFQPTAIAATSGATISSYLFDVIYGSATVAAGAEASNDVTYNFAEGFNVAKLIVTDSAGRTSTRYIPVFAHGASFPFELGFDGATITGDKGKWNATITGSEDIARDDVLDRTLTVIWSKEYYAGVETNLVSNVNFTGRLLKETTAIQVDEPFIQYPETTFQVEGPADALGSTSGQLVTLVNDASPAAWDEINDLTPWRAAWYVLNQLSTASYVCCFEFDDTSADYEYERLTTTSQDLYASIADLMFSRMQVLEFSAQGIGYINPDARYLTTAQRAALTTVLALTEDDRAETNIDREYREDIGKLSGYAGYYNTGSGYIALIGAYAPGVAQGAGIEDAQYNKQILAADQSKTDAESEWADRIANHFERLQPKAQLQVTMLSGAYHCIMPSVSQWWTWALPENDTGRPVYTGSTRWILERIECVHNHDEGSRSVALTFTIETEGGATLTFDPPVPSEYSFSKFDWPPFNTLPMFPSVSPFLPASPTVADFHPFPQDPMDVTNFPPKDGNTIVAVTRNESTHTESALFVTTNGLNPVPSWREITPSPDTEVRYFEYKSRIGENLEAYCLTYDGSDTTFWYTENFIEGEWTDQFTWEDLRFDYIRIAPEGGVYVVGTYDAGTPSSYTDNMTTGLGANTSVPGASYPFGFWGCPGTVRYYGTDPAGTYNAAGGRTGGGCVLGDDSTCVPPPQPTKKNEATAIVDLGVVTTITAASFYHVQSAAGIGHSAAIRAYDASGTYITDMTLDSSNSSTSWRQITFSGVQAARYIVFTTETLIGTTTKLDDLSITYGTPGGAISTYTDDDGTTFTGIQTIGTTPGTEQCGSDSIKVGLLASGEQPFLAGALTQVMTTDNATSGGDVYTTETNSPASPINPVCIVVPFYASDGTTKNTETNTPEYLVGSNTADGSGDTIYYVTTGGAAALTQPSAGYVVYNPAGMAMGWWNSSKIAALMSTGGTDIKLFTSDDGGTTWDDRGVVGGIGSGAAQAVQFRQGDTTELQLFFASAQNGVGYSEDFGATITYRDAPSINPQIVRFIRVFG